MVQQEGQASRKSLDNGFNTRYLSAGQYLGFRLLQLGVKQVYVVPGDFNLPMLDDMARVPGLQLVNCASELGCAYAADGQARAVGLGCCATTFLVGALSAINGIAASYAEEIPVLSIVGVPSTKEYAGTLHTLHHTLGNAEDMSQEVDCYKPVTCYQTILRSFVDARYLIDKALSKALLHRKPVLLEVCRDMPLRPHPSFGPSPSAMGPFPHPRLSSGPEVLATAAAGVAEFLNTRKMPVILAGRRARLCQQQLAELVEVCQYPVVVLLDGKGFFCERHPAFVGTYFRGMSDPVTVRQLVESSDGLLCVGVHFNELAWGPPPDETMESRAVLLYKSRAVVGLHTAYTGVDTNDLLASLKGLLKPNTAGLDWFRSQPVVHPTFPPHPDFQLPEDVPFKLATFYELLQHRLLDNKPFISSHGSCASFLSSCSSSGDLAGGAGAGSTDGPVTGVTPGVTYDIMVDTSDSLLRSHRFQLPQGGVHEVQVFAGNIGWAPAAGLGFSLARQAEGKRLVLLCGDGGLQMTASEIGNYAKFGSTAVMVVVNNEGYLIERYVSPIVHSGYNYVKRWNHVLLAEAMCNGEGKYKVLKVTNEEEAKQALDVAATLTDHFIFIEVVVDKRDAAPGATAFRQGFMAAHFVGLRGYEHLNTEFDTVSEAAPQQLKRRSSDAGAIAQLQRMSSAGVKGLAMVEVGGGDVASSSAAPQE